MLKLVMDYMPVQCGGRVYNTRPTFQWNVLCSFTGILCIASNPNKHEIKYTTDTVKSVSYLKLHLEIDGEGKV